MKHQITTTRTIQATKLAKLSGAGRNTKYVMFTMSNNPDNHIIVGEIEDISPSGLYTVLASDNNETVVCAPTTVMWWFDPALLPAWKKDAKANKGWLMALPESGVTIDKPEPEIVAVQAQILADILPLAEDLELDDTQFLADEYEVEQALEGEHRDERLIKPDLSRYIKLDYTTASGKRGLASPDVVSLTVLAGLLHPDQWYAKLIQIATDFDDLTAGRGKDKWEINLANLQQRYGKLNPGQIRMNVGNLIRGILKRHGEI